MRVDPTSCKWIRMSVSKLLLHCHDGSLTASQTKGPPVGPAKGAAGQRGGGRAATVRHISSGFLEKFPPTAAMRCLALLCALLLLLACAAPTQAHEGHSDSTDPPADQSATAALSPSAPQPAANSDKDTVDKQKAQQKWNLEHGLGEETEGGPGTAEAAAAVSPAQRRSSPSRPHRSAAL